MKQLIAVLVYVLWGANLSASDLSQLVSFEFDAIRLCELYKQAEAGTGVEINADVVSKDTYVWLRTQSVPWETVLSYASCLNGYRMVKDEDSYTVKRSSWTLLKEADLQAPVASQNDKSVINLECDDEEIIFELEKVADTFGLNLIVSERLIGTTGTFRGTATCDQALKKLLEPISFRAIRKDAVVIIDSADYLCCPPCFEEKARTAVAVPETTE